MSTETVTITVDLPEEQALALAQFCKRVGHSDCLSNAVNNDEAYLMLYGLEQVRKGLAELGYAPR